MSVYPRPRSLINNIRWALHARSFTSTPYHVSLGARANHLLLCFYHRVQGNRRGDTTMSESDYALICEHVDRFVQKARSQSCH